MCDQGRPRKPNEEKGGFVIETDLIIEWYLNAEVLKGATGVTGRLAKLILVSCPIKVKKKTRD